ncbi:MAG: ASKHA domain-containing protein [bacterium]
MEYKIKISQSKNEKVYRASAGRNLLNFLQEHGYNIPSYCGGRGTCGKCKVKINFDNNKTSKDSPGYEEACEHISPEEKKAGYRLACKIDIDQDLSLEIDHDTDISALSEGTKYIDDIDPVLSKKNITLNKPDLDDQRSYLEKIFTQLSLESVDYNSLQQLDVLKNIKEKTELTVTFNQQTKNIIDIEPHGRAHNFYGIACDLGTTTVVFYLHDLTTGDLIDVYSFNNPQQNFGADVLSRIDYTIGEKKGQKKMQQKLINKFNQSINQITEKNDLKPQNINLFTVVGNTIMLHFLLDINAASIASAPYIPVFTENINLKPEELKLNINSGGLITIMDSISGYVGADIMAGIVACEMEPENNEINLLVDIGTNGEIVLKKNSQIFACSTAAGPAFEGTNIACGMAGVPGAVSHFQLNETGEISLETIKGIEPRGICGSGLLDIIANLLNKDIIDQNGKFKDKHEVEPQFRKYITKIEGQNVFWLSQSPREVYITQKDVREVQLAKGAIQTGINILKKELDITDNDLDNIYLAGGFGNYMDPHNACQIGLLPKKLEDKIKQIGNSAGTGARMYLLNRKTQDYIDRLKQHITYLELSKIDGFQTEYMKSMQF